MSWRRFDLHNLNHCRQIHKDIANDPLHRWLTFFDQNISDDLLKELMDMYAAIQKTNEKMTFLANDKEMLRLYNVILNEVSGGSIGYLTDYSELFKANVGGVLGFQVFIFFHCGSTLLRIKFVSSR